MHSYDNLPSEVNLNWESGRLESSMAITYLPNEEGCHHTSSNCKHRALVRMARFSSSRLADAPRLQSMKDSGDDSNFIRSSSRRRHPWKLLPLQCAFVFLRFLSPGGAGRSGPWQNKRRRSRRQRPRRNPNNH